MYLIPHDEVRRTVLAACQRARSEGEGLGTHKLRGFGARGLGPAIRRVRDELIAEGLVDPPATPAPIPPPAPAGPPPRPAPTGYVDGLRADIEAAAAEYVARGELPASGEAWRAAVLEQGERRRERAQRWSD